MESLLVDDIDSIRSLEVVTVHILIYEYDSHRHRAIASTSLRIYAASGLRRLDT